MSASQETASGSADVSIVGGAGHVGLPLGLVLAQKGLRVLLCDINGAALDIIKSGRMPALDEGAEPILKEALAKERLLFSTETSDATNANTVVITIGTPVDEFHSPVHKTVQDCVDQLLPGLTDDHLIVLRSTVYPGTTDWLARYLDSVGKHSMLSFCPERVVQGNSIRELQDMPQIVSGTTSKSVQAATEFFGHFAPEIVELKPLEAEFSKLFTNAYRYVEFAITNEFFTIANSAGADYYKIIEAMTHNYPRAQRIAKPGFTAGPCLFKDTMQLVAFARNQFNLGHAAMLVNEGLVLYVVDRLLQTYDLNSMTVGILGMAFKADSDDVRASLSYKMKKALMTHARDVLTTDPIVTSDPELLPLGDVLERSDILILCTPHSAYRALDAGGKPLIDIWNHVDGGLI